MASPAKIKVLLVDDHSIVREGIRSSLTRHPFISVVGEATNGKEAIQKCKRLSPDILLMDLNMPEMGGLEATPLVRKLCPKTKVIVLTVHDNKEYVFQILGSGAQGYVLKDTSPEELVQAIIAVAKGQAFFSPGISQLILDDYVKAAGSPPSKRKPLLSGREKDVLQAIAEGKTTKEVAVQFNLSARTVETHRIRMRRKLKARNVAELLKRAREQGIL